MTGTGVAKIIKVVVFPVAFSTELAMILNDVFIKNNVIFMPTKPTKPKIVDFRQGQEELHRTLRQGMLDAATRLLTEEGPAALTVRRVAESVNCSTTLLYSLFGGKDGLSNALYLEGFARLKVEFAANSVKLTKAKGEAGLQRLNALAQIYHQYAK